MTSALSRWQRTTQTPENLMPSITPVEVGSTWKAVDTEHNAPVILWNGSADTIAVRFHGAPPEWPIAPDDGIQVAPYTEVEARCDGGPAVIQVLRGIMPLELLA